MERRLVEPVTATRQRAIPAQPAGITGLAAPPLEERAGAVTFGSAGPRPVVPCRQTESAKGCRDIRCSGASGESSRIFRRGGQPTDYPVEAAHPPKETNSFAACIGLGGNVELTGCRRFLRQRHGEPCRHVCDSSRLHRLFGRAPIIAHPGRAPAPPLAGVGPMRSGVANAGSVRVRGAADGGRRTCVWKAALWAGVGWVRGLRVHLMFAGTPGDGCLDCRRLNQRRP